MGMVILSIVWIGIAVCVCILGIIYIAIEKYIDSKKGDKRDGNR